MNWAGILQWAVLVIVGGLCWALGVGRGRQLQAREDTRKLANALHRESVRQ